MPTKIIIGGKYGMLTVCLPAALFPADVCKRKPKLKSVVVKNDMAGALHKNRHVSQNA